MKRSELREHLFLMLFRKDFHETDELKEQAQFYLDSTFSSDLSNSLNSSFDVTPLTA